MRANGLIDLEWNEDGCTNGLEAMAQAAQIYNEAKPGERPATSEKMNSIVAYNEIDCKAIYQIIDYIRTFHPQEPQEDDGQLGTIPMQIASDEEDSSRDWLIFLLGKDDQDVVRQRPADLIKKAEAEVGQRTAPEESHADQFVDVTPQGFVRVLAANSPE